MFRRLLLGALLLLPGAFSAQLQAQVDPIGRPRRTQTTPASTETTAPPETNSRAAHSTDPDADAKRLFKVGVKYGHAGLYQQAAETFEQVVKLKPDYGEAYLSLGHAYYDLGRWAQAVDSIQRGLALKPGDKPSRNRLAHAQKMLEQDATRPTASEDGVGTGATAAEETAKPTTNDQLLTKIYRVGPGDVLDVRVTDDVPARPTLFTVSAAGFLEHPDLSVPLMSAGLTVAEITARIEDDLKKRPEIKNPKVSVAVQEYISHTILVSGLVKEPGTKSLKREGIPLYVVIADAQPMPEAGRVTVQRNASNENFAIDLSESSVLNMLVRPGDVISLIEKPIQFFYMSGAVKSPGEKTYRRGLTLTQAIIAAGGLSKDAKEAQVGRDNGQGFLAVSRYKLKEIESGKVADPAIEPGDRITIND